MKNNAGRDVAERYLATVEGTCKLLGRHPQLGPRGILLTRVFATGVFFVVFRPFKKHVLFYEVSGADVVMRRAMHGHRDLPKRLLEPPEPK